MAEVTFPAGSYGALAERDYRAFTLWCDKIADLPEVDFAPILGVAQAAAEKYFKHVYVLNGGEECSHEIRHSWLFTLAMKSGWATHADRYAMLFLSHLTKFHMQCPDCEILDGTRADIEDAKQVLSQIREWCKAEQAQQVEELKGFKQLRLE